MDERSGVDRWGDGRPGRRHPVRAPGFAIAVGLAALVAGGPVATAAGAAPDAAAPGGPAPWSIAQEDAGEGGGDLEPTYRPRPPEPEPWYDSSYLFALTRGVAGSTLAPAAKAPMFFFTLPLDLVLLPATAIAGLF